METASSSKPDSSYSSAQCLPPCARLNPHRPLMPPLQLSIREQERFCDRRTSLLAAVEQSLKACSLKTIAQKQSNTTLLCSVPSPSHGGGGGGDGSADWDQANGNFSARATLLEYTCQEEYSNKITTNDNNSSHAVATIDASSKHCGKSSNASTQEPAIPPASRESRAKRPAARLVRHLEGIARVAEHEHSRRARALVRLKAGAAIRERRCNHHNVGFTVKREENPIPSAGEVTGWGVQGRDIVECCGCIALFEANATLLQNARARGLA